MIPAQQSTPDPERDFLLSWRQSLLIQLAAIEKRLGMQRSTETREERRERHEQERVYRQS